MGILLPFSISKINYNTKVTVLSEMLMWNQYLKIKLVYPEILIKIKTS